jgi:uncharacterized membrane protein YeiH
MSAANDPRTRVLPALAYALDLLGVVVFAISGALAGIHRGLDLFGVAVLAAATGVGGGTVRDVLLGRQPIFWIRDPRYLYAIIGAAALSILARNSLPSVENALLVADAFGLGLCALSGARIAEAAGNPWIVTVLLGTMSGVTGGVIRDVLSGVVPLLLRRDIYATAAIAGICCYLLLQVAGIKRSGAFVVGIVTVVLVRLAAIAFAWQLPVFANP